VLVIYVNDGTVVVPPPPDGGVVVPPPPDDALITIVKFAEANTVVDVELA
jgi:hypothetical protein